MNNDHLVNLSRAPVTTTWVLTVLSCALVAAASIAPHPAWLILLAVCVPLCLTAAIQVHAVAPLAAELLRLREQQANARS